MFYLNSVGPQAPSSRALPWLHFFGALVVLVLNALYSAVYSPLGLEISVGESPGFAWIRTHITMGMGIGLVYLILVCWIQLGQKRRPSFVDSKGLPCLVCLQCLSIAAVPMLLFSKQAGYLPLASSVLLLSSLIQGMIAFWRLGLPDVEHLSVVSQNPAASAKSFFILLFIFGAAGSSLDPSWHRMADHIVLDTPFESHLRYIFPPISSGVTSLWLGIGMLTILLGSHHLFFKFFHNNDFEVLYFLIFFSICLVFTGLLFITLYYAISWQIDSLHLNLTIGQFVLFLSVSGAIFFSGVFYKIHSNLPEPQQGSMIGMVSLTFGAGVLFPIAWVLTHGRITKNRWTWLLICTLGACVFIGYVVLFGDLFDPWFTTFSYIKGAILKILFIVAAGTGVLLIEQLYSLKPIAPPRLLRLAVALSLAAISGFLPFYALGKHPEVKTVVLQFNELTRVDATFAREFAAVVGIGRWIHLGQRPSPNHNPHPWPHPWKLSKSHSSRLPEDFNVLVIIVDALRGDAFHSAGYRRNLTPFLDRWAAEEAVSFRRAYSQGGGTFAAVPFLVAGRSRFELYGPDLYRQNLYFKLARAEGIQHYMLMKGFGPRDIYPPDFPLTELSIPLTGGGGRSAMADEVFAAARKAIDALPMGERFLCFLQLMDVHNDLWKKDGGMDFGDTPRDLYDNNLSYLDRAMSRFVLWLKEKGIYEKTVVLFTSDHGEQFWEHGASLHGHTVYEEEIRIPLIFVTHRNHKRLEDVPIIAADLAPTIADLAGYSIEPPYDDPHMGISLVPLLLDKDRQRYLKRDVVGRASFKRRYFLYRNWEWKLVYFAELDLLQLFNVVQDPLEKENLLHEYPSLAATMEQDLLDYLGKVEGKNYHRQLAIQQKKD